MSSTSDNPGNHTVDVVFDHLGFRRAVTVGGGQAVLWNSADLDLGSPH